MGLCSSKDPSAPPPANTAPTAGDKRSKQQKAVDQTNNQTSADSSGNVSSEKAAAQRQQEQQQQVQQQQQPQHLTTNGQSLKPGSAPNSTAQSRQSSAQTTNGIISSPISTDKEVKVLLLGSGESGKSTIVKQMKILHKNGFSDEELYEYKPFVFKNVLDCVKNVVNAIIDLQPDLIAEKGTSEEDLAANIAGPVGERKHILRYDDLNEVLDYEVSVSSEEQFNPSVAAKIKTVYNFKEVHDFMEREQGKFYLIDSTDYMLSNVERIAAPDYVPNQSDILRTRKKTSGIFDFRFQMSGVNMHMFDVGGQRSERKKWIHCFDNVTLIIFCVALSEYDQALLEEDSQNRLEESLTLFDSVVNSRWFSRTSIVLFLNKIDVFAKKLPFSPLENYFPDYNGGDNINKAVKYILWRFTQVNRSGLNIYPHVTQATDTSNIQLVFAAVKETILENSLRDSGILNT
ncbi:hypothetical protein FT663_00342 [Candidozyma haemuli var. vulneris]|uniref:Guanine nucleotide-binding protein alpha-2 subunit n=1 Tax=Candidozyma haemuli TaxID=45357 RepID=A0A2V1AR62_9ASCO|nr:hypothetical protein CXQ85_002008 [[Candida] haemuloni]KAF3992969.1 hypothetical protein FT662_00792 [[Candida] haemuloni var. vulneris]KAF3995595.1 hypothetical protein FT663_00342 [[Candida] haemuloni var. vulneris]PVH20224.1 hypothetical protein CXQ85_002008 [[Candida] haemuloni]